MDNGGEGGRINARREPDVRKKKKKRQVEECWKRKGERGAGWWEGYEKKRGFRC